MTPREALHCFPPTFLMTITYCKGVFSMNIPNDPIILLSYINTLLRDEYSDFDELCSSLCIKRTDVENKLNGVGFYYDAASNSFK